MKNVYWTDKVTNTKVSDKVSRWRAIIDYVKEGKIPLFGHMKLFRIRMMVDF